MTFNELLILALAYLLGSIPFGYLLVKLKSGDDIRAVGSGGTGATNVSRKAGLAASGRIGQEPRRGEGLGTKVARGTGNLLLDTVAGGLGQDIARGAGVQVIGFTPKA